MDMTEDEFFKLVEMTIIVPEVRVKLRAEIARIMKRREEDV
jgi:hypothetical protein